MGFQINFTVSDEKEREFFDFLGNDCSCNILRGYSEDRDFSIDVSEIPSLPLYLIVPSACADNFRIEPFEDIDINAKFCISPFDENGDFYLPLIRYDRFDEPYRRIYADLSTVPADGKEQIKEILAKIKKWIKSNAKSHYHEWLPIFGITVYYVS